MKINQVKQFAASNISRFERSGKKSSRCFNLYDKNNVYRGEYQFISQSRSEYLGVKKSLSITRIMNKNLKQDMQEIVFMDKDYVTLKDKNSETLTKALPSKITTITTVVDYVKDQFKTVMKVSKLKNKLQKIGKNDSDFIASDRVVIYEPLKEKPQYEKSIEYVREGSISEVNQTILKNRVNNRKSSKLQQIPYKFW